MTLATRLRSALEAIPPGSLVPRDWLLELLARHGTTDVVDMTVADVAGLLDRAPSTIRTWCAAGRLKGAYRLCGREWRIPRAALRAVGDSDASAPLEPAAGDGVDLGRWRRHAR